jgi:hypothetical protein
LIKFKKVKKIKQVKKTLEERNAGWELSLLEEKKKEIETEFTRIYRKKNS